MKDKPRKQLSLRFDNYVDLLDEAEKYARANNTTITHLVATGLRLAMTRQQPSQLTSYDKTNDDRLANLEERQAKIEEQLATTSQASAIAIDREQIKDEIDSRTAYLATAMNEVKAQLENEIEILKNELKQLKEDRLTHPPVKPEVTKQDVPPALPQEEIKNAIATGEILTPIILNKKYFICKNCNNQGYADADFTKEGYTKSGTQRWKCGKCKSIRSESTIIASPPIKMPQENTNDWKEETANFLDGVNQWEK